MELEHRGRRYLLQAPDTLVGSDPAAAVVVPGLQPRHALIRPLGDRMATIRPAEDRTDIEVNGVAIGREAMPLLHGDRVRIGAEDFLVIGPVPADPSRTPPSGARERLHDTQMGLPVRRPDPPAT